jgi:RNA polymerase sigma-70 factor, ECF subfamily
VKDGLTDAAQITILLKKVHAGEEKAADRLFEAVYQDLRRMARQAMAGERKDHTLQPTALVNEAFVALFKKGNIDWQSRGHFFAQMAVTMRHKLVDHAKKHNAQMRRHESAPLEAAAAGVDEDLEELLALDEALTKLRGYDPEFERIVELRFYAGLTDEEVASELGMCARTVKRKWAAARGLLLDILGESRKRAAATSGPLSHAS